MKTKGHLAERKSKLPARCQGNSRLILVLSAAFVVPAAPPPDRVGGGGGGIFGIPLMG